MEERDLFGEAVKKSRKFALRVAGMYRDLQERRVSQAAADEVLRAGMGIGRYLAEAEADRGGMYFGSLRLRALRDCRDARYWIDLLHETGCIPDVLHSGLSADCEELLRILSAADPH
jgi:four helix bundle protein